MAGLRDSRLCLVFPALWETSMELGASQGLHLFPLNLDRGPTL